jgi:3-mercaptopyruvate sulfurtransferase SseA
MAEHELPVAEVYRGVEIYGGQSHDRVAAAKREIDAVIALADRRRLAGFACDAGHAPEARLLAKNKALASLEQRQRMVFDVHCLSAATIGIERRTTVIGRLIGWRDAGWWPEAWRP